MSSWLFKTKIREAMNTGRLLGEGTILKSIDPYDMPLLCGNAKKHGDTWKHI